MRRFVDVWLVLGFLWSEWFSLQKARPPPEKHILSRSTTCWPWTGSRTPGSRPTASGSSSTSARPTSEGNRGRTDIWIVGTDGTDLRRLTSHPAADFNARWSPCGQVRLLPLHPVGIRPRSGASRSTAARPSRWTKLAARRRQPHRFSGRANLAFTMEVFPGESAEATARQARGHRKKARPPDGSTTSSSSATGTPGATAAAPTSSSCRRTGGEAKDLMPAMDADTPTKPFGGPEEIAFTPDGKGLVFTASDVGREEAWSTDFDLY